MKLKQSINAKMLIYLLTTTILIFTISISYFGYNTRKIALQDAEIIAKTTAHENALKIEKKLSEYLAVIKTLAQAFSVYEEMEEDEWKTLFLKMYKKVYKQNPEFYKLWDSWELKFFDDSWTKDFGRYAVTVFDSNGSIKSSESIRSENGDNELYAQIKSTAKNMLWEPYWDEYLEESEEKKFMTTVSSPIIRNNKFAGLIAADIIMVQLQEITNQVEALGGSHAYLVSNEGVFVSHPDLNLIGEAVSSYFQEYEDQFGITEKIKDGTSGVYKASDFNGEKALVTVAPIMVGNNNSPWSLVLTIPYNSILNSANKAIFWSFIGGLIGLIILSLIILKITSKIGSSLVRTNNIMNKLAIGDIDNIEDFHVSSNDELGSIAQSLTRLKNNLKTNSNFAKQMGEGELNSDFTPSSDKDILGNSLLTMRESLKNAKLEEDKRKLEDEKQNWSTQGIAKFGEILRNNSTNIKELSFNIMSNLVTYLEVNQGALFIVEKEEDEEPYLELKNAIAYGRDKYMKKRYDFGQSLVGRAAFEMKSIYMTEIPEDYIQITSGMGTSNPRELLIVPLILNDEVYGVIELSTFKKIELHQIDFVEKLGESIASTIASVKVNEKTTHLLERSKGQAEELAAQEEEMRQNLEELQATQEEAARREFEMSGVVNALGTTAFTVEYDLDGTILSCNDKYADMLGMSKENILGKKHRDGYDESSEMGSNYELFWSELCNGITKKQTNKVTINNNELWVEESYTPIKEPNETKPYKILKIGFDITEQKLREIKMQTQQDEIEKEREIIDEYTDQINKLKLELKQAKDTIKSLELQPNERVKKETPAPPQQKEIQASGNNLIDWNSNFALGVEEMDEQHEQLVNLANTLYASYVQGKNKKEIKENLRSFIDFASYHFGNEEQYFEEFDFDKTESHTNSHHQLLKELKQVQSAYNTNKIKEIDSILAFIKEWLNEHITTFDKDYIELFKLKGL